MRMRLVAGAAMLAMFAGSGCAEIPPESVMASRQIERNLETLRENNLALLDEWYELSLDYWTEKVGREGPDKILDKARQAGMTVDISQDYPDLVEQVLKEYRANFLSKLNEAHQNYRDAINADYRITMDGARSLTNLLQSAVEVDAERAALLTSVASKLEVKDDVERVQTELTKLFSS